MSRHGIRCAPLPAYTLIALQTQKTEDSKMTKSELRELNTINRLNMAGLDANVALALSSLVRSCRNKKSREEMIDYAHAWNVQSHPDFII